MDPYGRGAYDYRYDPPPPDRKVPRSYDPYPQSVQYPRPAQRVYAAPPAAVSYPAPPSNRRVEYRYYDPDEGLPVPVPLRPTPAPVVAAVPPGQIRYPTLPSGFGQQFAPGDVFKVVGVEEAQIYKVAPPVPRADPLSYDYPRADPLSYDYGYVPPPVSRGVPQRRLPYGPYY